jgi:hypothetical protein
MAVQGNLLPEQIATANQNDQVSGPVAGNPTGRRHFFARLAGLGLKLTAVASLVQSAERSANAATAELTSPLPLNAEQRRAADVARLAANLAQPDTAVGKVAIYRLGEKQGDPTLQMVSPGVWRRCGAKGLEGEPITDAELGRSGVRGINADGQLVVHDSNSLDAGQAAARTGLQPGAGA